MSFVGLILAQNLPKPGADQVNKKRSQKHQKNCEKFIGEKLSYLKVISLLVTHFLITRSPSDVL